MNFIYLRHFLSITVTLMLVGCVTWTPPIPKNEVPTGNESYLYGKFQVDATKSIWSIDDYSTLGYVVSCDDGKKYTIRFRIDEPIQVIKLNPSICTLNVIIYTDGDGVRRGWEKAPLGSPRQIILEPSFAYYIGDYSAVSKTNIIRGTRIEFIRHIKDVHDSYEATTNAMRSLYPNMVKVPTVNKMQGSNIVLAPYRLKVAPNSLHAQTGAVVYSPNEPGWFQAMPSNKFNINFGRYDGSATNSTIFMTNIITGDIVKNDSDFLNVMNEKMNTTNDHRHKILQVNSEQVSFKNTTCIKYKWLGEDHKDSGIKSNTFLYFKRSGYLCQHPTNKASIFQMEISHRSNSKEFPVELFKTGESFFSTIKFNEDGF